MKEKILDSRLEFTLQDILNISKKEVHDVENDLMKRTRHSTKREEMGPDPWMFIQVLSHLKGLNFTKNMLTTTIQGHTRLELRQSL